MTYRNIRKSILSLSLTLAIAACATGPEPASEGQYVDLNNELLDQTTENLTSPDVTYVIQSGDGLGHIAEKFTGLISNWQEIAAYNNINNPRGLIVGGVIQIPGYLIPGNETVALSNSFPEPVTTKVTRQDSQSTTLAVRVSEGAVLPVVVTPVNTNRDFELNPIDPNAPTAPQSYSGSGAQVKVIGSYYPKGIYTEPAAYSKLIMRVAPGTMFPLVSKINDWFKIDTKTGPGYIRAEDAAIMK